MDLNNVMSTNLHQLFFFVETPSMDMNVSMFFLVYWTFQVCESPKLHPLVWYETQIVTYDSADYPNLVHVNYLELRNATTSYSTIHFLLAG